MSGLPSFSFVGSAASSAEEAFWTWRSITSPLFDVSMPDSRAVEAFEVEVDSYHLGPLVFGSVSANAQRFHRSPRTIARSGIDHYVVQLYSQGGYAGEVDGQDIQVKPGDISILDLSRTLQTQAERFHNLNCIVPRTMLEPLLRHPDGLHGTVLSGRTGLGHVLGTYLQTIYKTAGSLSAEDGAAISEATASLIAGCFGPSANSRETVATAKKGALLLTIKRYIEANLADPDLTVESMTREFHVSRATLVRMFEPLGGLSGYIRERRMFRCFAELTSPSPSHRSIADLAYSWGFGNEAAFSRAFRRMFGMSPREARAEGTLARVAVQRHRPGSSGPAVAQWIRDLQM
ncbi:helix-turn-helix domain-containing protein [Microvirga sp. Mcv34]|uniref:helix-turn-helix domain-containing protein n=1 Tax=Microvirga sp. Mcv34 TaxID=2926016 RepID=UPI0021C7DE4D|nr:helix-turn-helix domain-containing protein [Microvirga sp. Mcv34]